MNHFLKRYLGRLTLALALTLSGLFATNFFFGRDLGGARRGKENPIAKLAGTQNEVQRKPLGRIVWETVTQGEDLYAGEDIRTSTASRARIFLTESKATIDLDPDSIIRLESGEAGLALNFLAGNMLVKGSGITVKAGAQEINVGQGADLSLSKTAQGSVDLEVLKGQAELATGNRKVALTQATSGTLTEDGVAENKTRLKLTAPTVGEPVLIDPTSGSLVTFSWPALPPGYVVAIERGDSRSSLAKLSERMAAGETGTLAAPFRPGNWYFRLVATSTEPGQPELSTKVFPLEVTAKTPPTLTAPTRNQVVTLDEADPELHLRWSARLPFQSFVVEIAKDASLRDVPQRLELEGLAREKLVPWPNSGPAFVRITGYLNHQGQMIAVPSPVERLSVRVGMDLTAPEPKSPMSQQRLTIEQVQKQGVLLSWGGQSGAEKYVLRLKGPSDNTAQEQEALSTPVRLKDLKPGKYEWSVAAVSPSGKTSPFSGVREFTIEDVPRLDWADGESSATYEYVTAQPSLQAAWSSKTPGATKWQLRWAKEGEMTGATPWNQIERSVHTWEVPEPGRYAVEVEALNDQGQVVARAPMRIFQVEPKPTLPAPEFAKNLPVQISSDRRGTLNLEWQPVSGAKEYEVQLQAKGSSIAPAVTRVDRNLASLKRLKPGKYEVSIRAIDEHSRAGAASPPRTVEVPELSDILPPKIKKLKVK